MHYYLIAGEASGDVLGAKLMRALKAAATKNTRLIFSGVGGKLMQAEGLKSLFPMKELSLMGFLEILPHAPKLLRRVRETAEDIKQKSPDVVVTIDSPGFNFRVVRKLNEAGWRDEAHKLVHYVAPTVWAYKPERAQKVAGLYDHLLLLLPFEPPYFDEVGLANSFIGHPLVEDGVAADGSVFRKKHGIAEDANIMVVLAGSRRTETKRLLPVLQETVALLKARIENLVVVVPTVPGVEVEVRKAVEGWAARTIVTTEAKRKYEAYAAADFALAKSGTGTLELALAGVPMVVTYKVHPVSAHMMRKMIRVPYVNLINLLEDKPVIPELLQENCTPQKLSGAIMELYQNEEQRNAQKQAMQAALLKLGRDILPLPSAKAAKVLLDFFKVKKK